MSDEGKRSSGPGAPLTDREHIEERRRKFVQRIENEARRRSVAEFHRQRPGVCLSMSMRPRDSLRKGEWAPDEESRALATDPEAPAELLVHLSRHLPDEVLSNPALPLGLMTRPETLQQATPETLLVLARHPRTPPSLLEAIGLIADELPEVRRALVEHPEAPESLRRALGPDRGE